MFNRYENYRMGTQTIRIGSSCIIEGDFLVSPRGNYNLNNRSDLYKLAYDYNYLYEFYIRTGLGMAGVTDSTNPIPKTDEIKKEKITNKLLLL